MPNVTEARYTKQLGPMVEPEFAARLEAWAKTKGVSVSTLVREMIERDLAAQLPAWEAELNTKIKKSMWMGYFRAALARTRDQGERHVTRRRAADDARAGRAGAAPATID